MDEPISKAEAQRLARRQLADYDARTPGLQFGEGGLSLGVEGAYQVQIEMARARAARGEKVAGYKIGCVSPTIQRQLGIRHPVFGHLFRSEIHTSPAILAASDFCEPAVEGELAVQLAADIEDPLVASRTPASLVRSVFPVIELHNYVSRGTGPSAAELIANNALHAGIVVPEPGGASARTGTYGIRVAISSRTDDLATVDPLEHLGELLARLDGHGIRPRKGDVLLTGSPLPLYPVGPGDEIRVSCEGLARVEARFMQDWSQ